MVMDGRIVAHLRVWDRTIRVRGENLRAGGIGGVLTHPEYRGRGIATALMRETEAYFLEAGYDLGLLFTIIGTSFYTGQNWTHIPLPTFTVDLSSEEVKPSEKVHRLSPDRDLDRVAPIYDRCIQSMTGPEVRKREYWRSGPSRIRGLFPLWGVDLEGELAGYVSVEPGGEYLTVKEACARPGQEEAFEDLARMVCAEARKYSVRRVYGSLPRGHALVAYLSSINGVSPVWDTHEKMMVKLVNWRALTEKLGGADSPALSPGDEGAFLRALFGLDDLKNEYGAWVHSLESCTGPFYWLSDIF